MAFTYPIQANFSRGELSPKLHARVDLEYYRTGLARCLNWTVLKQGGLRRRPGTLFVREVLNSSALTRLIPFVFGTPSNGIPQSYVIELGNGYAQFVTNGGPITTGGGTPSGITQANPAVVTLNAHGFVNGDFVFITGVGGMTELNNQWFVVAGAAANTFQLSSINTTSYSAFTSGGTIKKIVTLATPWLTADLFDLDYAQSADTLTVAALNYQTREITRTSDTAWSANTVTFKDGPYLDEPLNNTVTVTLSSTGAIHPKMTSNTLPSGVANGTVAATAWRVFDGDATTYEVIASTNGFWEYQPAAPAVCNNYWIKAGTGTSNGTPTSWSFDGWNGSAWVELDRQAAVNAWANGETRYFEFTNAIAYSKYRLLVSGTSAAGNMEVVEMGWGYNGDFAPTTTATFSGTSSINGGAGFSAADVGRNIRIRGADGKWRYFIITAFVSSTVVQGRMYGYALTSADAISRWKLGAFYGNSWPSKVGFYEARRAVARSLNEPYGLWFSKTFDFYDFGTSDPLVDDDGIRIRMQTGQVNGIQWIADDEELAVGTTNNIRVVGKSTPNQGFGATNVEHKTKTKVGASKVKPVRVGSALIYPDYYGKTLREFVYDLNQDGYTAPDLTLLSDHLFESIIVDMAYQQQPDSRIWVVVGNGHLVCVTYDRDQKMVGITDCEIAGGDPGTMAYVESVAAIPTTTQDEVYIIVRRTINGATRRYQERIAQDFESQALADGVFLDSALVYSGPPTNVVSGAIHLANLAVGCLADGAVVPNCAVDATGRVTLPNGVTASKIIIGRAYSSLGQSLPLAELSGDGVHLGRRKLVGDLKVSVMKSLGLKVAGLRTAFQPVFKRDQSIDPLSGPMVPRTGTYSVNFDNSWRDDGVFRFAVDDPLPCTIRAFIIGATGEP